MSMLKAHPQLKLHYLWLGIGYALIVLVIFLSLTSNPVDTGLSFPYEDKLFHAFAYFTLMAWFGQIYHRPVQRKLFAVIFIFLGILLEYLQSFDPNRSAEFGDMIANTSGVLLGYLLVLFNVKHCLLRIENFFS